LGEASPSVQSKEIVTRVAATSAVDTTSSTYVATVATTNDTNLVVAVFSFTKHSGGENPYKKKRKQEPKETTQLIYRTHTPYLLALLLDTYTNREYTHINRQLSTI
jgi:hypothetical protein